VKRQRFLWFFSLPFLGLVILFFGFSTYNRYSFQNRVEALVEEQLQATADILKAQMAHQLSEGVSPESIIPLYAGEENIYFMALLDSSRNVLGWISRFEGYLPLSLAEAESRGVWTLDSPAGKILNLFSAFRDGGDRTFFLYLGYSLSDLENMMSRSRRSFWLMFVLLCGVGILYFVGMYRLQTRYISKTRELQQQTREKEHFREISAFTSGVAHEIKNPLNSLALLCDLFEKKVPEELRRDAQAGKLEVRKVSRIIDQFSSSLKPIALDRERFPLDRLIEEVRRSFFQESGRSEDSVVVQAGGGLHLAADRTLLGQVLLNLLKNAHDAAADSEITINARRHKKRVIVAVRDTGPGIAPENLERVFDPFFSGKAQGLGIGLYLSKKIVEAHEGVIQVTSEPGVFTEFIVRLPGE
jgi:signal transduction histidine kinase